MKYNINTISNEAELLFFWGHRPSKDGNIIKSCFSQWWPCEFEEDGNTYNSAEQYMMAKKAALFQDYEIEKEIIASQDPKECKNLGRKVKNFEEGKWNDKKYQIVKQANALKFGQNNDLKEFLISTSSQVIVEASPYDQVWGIGLSQDDPRANQPKNWNGENLLGFALMEIRDLLSN